MSMTLIVTVNVSLPLLVEVAKIMSMLNQYEYY